MSGIEKKTEDDTAIDFLQLMRAEKRRARQQLKAASSSKATATISGSNSNKATVAATSSVPNTVESRLEVPTWNQNTRISEATFPTLYPVQHRIVNPPPSQSVDSIHYIPNFLSESYQGNLLQWLQALPEQQRSNASNKAPQEGCWNRMTYGKRRVALFSSTGTTDAGAVRLPSSVKDLCDNLLSLGGPFSATDSPATKRPGMPPPLQDLCDALVTSGVFEAHYRPNHILLNEYEPGQGILPHTDGPVYHSKTATLSIGQSNVLLNFAPRLATKDIGIVPNSDNVPTATVAPQVLLEGNGSLVIFANDAYTHYTHGIDVTDVEVASANCVNTAPGTLVQRGYRISLTFRHKL
jgi:alkylated DNA repair protein alkB family protein 6